MTNEEREKHIRIANMLIGAINDLIRPILMYQIEKDVTREALENYIKMLEQQPCEDTVSCNYTTEEIAKSFIEDVESVKDQLDGQTSEDCISRAYVESIVEELENICINGDDYILSLLSRIKNAPPVTPKTKIGHWILNEYQGVKAFGYSRYHCSECGREICSIYHGKINLLKEYPYCHCGAKMEVKE